MPTRIADALGKPNTFGQSSGNGRRSAVRDPNAGLNRITPQARPVNTFVAPALVAPDVSGHLDLARALGELNPKIQNYIQTYAKEVEEEDTAEGERLFAENRKNFADAVRGGLIPAGASPHLQRGYRLAQLRNAAGDYDAVLRRRYAEAGGPEMNDVDSFASGLFKEHKEKLGGGFTDEEFAEAFLPAMQRSIASLKGHHTNQRVAMFEEKRLAEYDVEINKLIDTSYEGGADFDIDEPGGSGIAATISERARELVGEGIKGSVVNALIRKAIIAKAEQERDIGLLSLLDEVTTGTGTLGQTSESRKAREAAEDRIHREIDSAETAQNSARTAAKKARKDELGSIGNGAVFALIGATTPEEANNALRAFNKVVATANAEGEDELVRTLVNFKDSYSRAVANPLPNGHAAAEALARAHAGEDPSKITAAFAGILPQRDLIRVGEIARSVRRKPGIFASALFSELSIGLGRMFLKSGEDPNTITLIATRAREAFAMSMLREAERLGVDTIEPGGELHEIAIARRDYILTKLNPDAVVDVAEQPPRWELELRSPTAVEIRHFNLEVPANVERLKSIDRSRLGDEQKHELMLRLMEVTRKEKPDDDGNRPPSGNDAGASAGRGERKPGSGNPAPAAPGGGSPGGTGPTFLGGIGGGA